VEVVAKQSGEPVGGGVILGAVCPDIARQQDPDRGGPGALGYHVKYSDDDEVATNVGFYYMANASGRLIGTLLFGVIFRVLRLYRLPARLWRLRAHCRSVVLQPAAVCSGAVDDQTQRGRVMSSRVHIRVLRSTFCRNEMTIAQNRWPRWVMWRSSGTENGTELDAPAGPKKGANVYVTSILSRTCEAAMITRFLLWRPSDWLSQARGFAHTWRLPAGLVPGRLRTRAQRLHLGG
jgi:hypothetical protein